MYEGTTVGVVVPAYNEEGFVGEVLETLPSYVDRAYVVDDRSTDATWEEIRETAERINDPSTGAGDRSVEDDDQPTESGGQPVEAGDRPSESADPPLGDGGFERRIVPLRHEANRGVGGAIKTGYLRAERDGVDVTAVMGGDGQMDPDELHKVIDPIVNGEADYAKGNRLLNADDREEMPGFRYVGNVILSYLTKIASGYWHIGDPQNGYTAISADALAGSEIEGMFEFYGYCNDLLVRLSAHGYRVVDVPIAARYRDEESDIDYRTYIPLVSQMLLRTFLWRLTVRRGTPSELVRSGLYVGGAVSVLVGVGSLLRSESVDGDDLEDGDDEESVVPDGSDTHTPRRFSGGRSMVVGVLLLICAMVADATINRSLNDTLE